MLWGNKAQEMEGALADYIMRESIDLQIWGHPSPISKINMKPNPGNFINCNHFTLVNNALRERDLPLINWALPTRVRDSAVLKKTNSKSNDKSSVGDQSPPAGMERRMLKEALAHTFLVHSAVKKILLQKISMD